MVLVEVGLVDLVAVTSKVATRHQPFKSIFYTDARITGERIHITSNEAKHRYLKVKKVERVNSSESVCNLMFI